MINTPNNDLSSQQQYRAGLAIQDWVIYILNPLAADKLQEAMMLLKSAKANANTKEEEKEIDAVNYCVLQLAVLLTTVNLVLNQPALNLFLEKLDKNLSDEPCENGTSSDLTQESQEPNTEE